MTLITKASDLFDGLKPEKKQPEDKEFKVERTPGLDAIVTAFFNVISTRIRGFYDLCVENIPSQYTPKDIEKFSLLLAEYEDLRVFDIKKGQFISALVNHFPEEHITIHTAHLKKPISNLGYKNEGHIIFTGDVGYAVGQEMKKGEIHVQENAKGYVGTGMEAGKIYINGNAGYDVGWSMRGGEIHLQGDFNGIGKIEGGNIFHKGIQIVKDGKLLK